MNALKTFTNASYALCAAVLLATSVVDAQPRTETRTTGTVLREGVPETYVVQRGDTLWDISARFLRDPWLWPDIWTVNPEIENPHLIFPGDIIRLVWVDGEPRLVLEREPQPDVERLRPRVREAPLDDAIRVIPQEVIGPFLGRPHFITRDELANAPYLLRSVDGRLMSGDGHRVYARGFNADHDMNLDWTIVRRGQPLREPGTRRVIGYEAVHVGEAVVDRLGDPATVRLVSSRQEALSGDRLINTSGAVLEAGLMPRAPRQEIDGLLVARLGGGIMTAQYHVAAINRGARHGLEPGMVVSVWREGGTLRDPHAGRAFGRRVQLPDERIGEMIVFRVWDTISYALVMRSTEEMEAGDRIRNP